MDLLDELEAMVRSVSVSVSDEIGDATIHRWQALFGFSFSEAIRNIEEFRATPGRFVCSDDHWGLVRHQKEAEGFDKEAYEYSCSITGHQSCGVLAPTEKQLHQLRSATYLVKLEGPLDTIEAVAKAANIKPLSAQSIVKATDATDQVSSFCEINGTAKMAIESFLSQSAAFPTFRPTFIRYSKARKNLSSSSLYPTLGLVPTMPQHRLETMHLIPRPTQTEYPVWYFFYGTLADDAVVTKLLGIQPEYHIAEIRGGLLKDWGKYKALVDDPHGNSVIKGKAFLVKDKEQEEALQVYETDMYEVVRCHINMGGGSVTCGLTFRFRGETD